MQAVLYNWPEDMSCMLVSVHDLVLPSVMCSFSAEQFQSDTWNTVPEWHCIQSGPVLK